MVEQRNELRQLAQTAVWYADTYQWWFPFKRVTIAVLRRAVDDDKVAAELNERRQTMYAGEFEDEPPTLAQLITMIFEVVLLIYGPALPFGGYWVRVVRDFVLQYLDRLPLPTGLKFGAVR